MKKLVAVVLLSFAASVGSAQENQRLIMPINLQCDAQSDKIAKFIKKDYQEQNFAKGKVSVQAYNTGLWQTVDFELYVNPGTKTWTMIAKMNDGVDCLLGSGNNFVPWSEKSL